MCVCSSPRGGGLRAGAGSRPGAMLRCAALALLCAALAHADRGKRAEMSPVPFVMGSRYGRSPERVMSPRNDRFFMGSRYGKRSGVMEDESEELQGVWKGCERDGTTQCRRLVCRYAGVPHLFKCMRTHDFQFTSRRSVADTRAGDSDE